MSKLIVAALCAVLAFPALAEEEKSLAESVTPPASEQNQTPADVEMAKVRAEQQAASGVPAAPATAQPAGAAEGGAPAGAAAGSAPSGAAQAQAVEPKSSIPLDKRQGGDITQCLEAGDKSDKAINACADKYRPRAH